MNRPRSGSSMVVSPSSLGATLFREGDTFVTIEKPLTEEPQNWQQRTKRRLTPKKQQQKTMEVFLDEHVREGIKALAVINNMPAQDYAEHILSREVERNSDLVRQGRTILEEAHGNITNARLKYLELKAGGNIERTR